MSFSRRAMFASLALPIATATIAIADSAAASVDPIFVVIERHRAAWAALEAIDELAEPGRYAAAEAELLASHDALVATSPQTVAGCRALIDFAIEDADAAGEGQCADTLKVVRRALDRLSACQQTSLLVCDDDRGPQLAKV